MEKTYLRTGVVDMEALEQGMRVAALKDGARHLGFLIARIGDGSMECTECDMVMNGIGRRKKDVTTLLGETSVKRLYCKCPGCNTHSFPKDKLLDIENTSFSPGVRRLMARCGARDSFARGEEDLFIYSGINVGEKDIERISEAIGADIQTGEEVAHNNALENPPDNPSVPLMYIACDGTGVPVIKKETAGRKGKQIDGIARTREAKLGCVFTQTGTDTKGRPVRDEGSTTYTGAIETSEVFGNRLYAEALSRGLLNASNVVVLGDGARWIWNLADFYFPEACHIVDLYHAREHLHALIKILSPPGETASEWFAFLEEGNIEKLIESMSKVLPLDENNRSQAKTEVEYFKTNACRMRYAEYRKKNFFVGSGVIEAGCKNIIASRMKKSGARWSIRGANSIIALRCCLASSRFEDYWADRIAA